MISKKFAQLSEVAALALIVGGTPQRVVAQSNQAPLATSSTVLRDAADSSEAARNAYRAGSVRLRSGDTTGALALFDSASRHWPMQPVYIDVLLQLAAKARDTAMVRTALTRSTGRHIGFSPYSTATAEKLELQLPVRALMTAQLLLAAPDARSQLMHTLPDSTFFPEGIAADVRTGRIFVASVHRREIVSVSSTGEMRTLVADSSFDSVFGLAIDTTRNLLWATTNAHPSMVGWDAQHRRDAQLIAVNLNNGRVERRISFPSTFGRSNPGDLAVTSQGDVFVADAVRPVLWKLSRNGTSLDAITNRLFRSLQGIVASPDGHAVWVADYAHGLLHVVFASQATDVSDSGSIHAHVSRVVDLPDQTTVGIDGMIRFGDTFIGVQNGVVPPRIVQLQVDATGTRLARFSVLDQNPIAASPTAATVVGNNLVYVANSLWEMLTRDEQIPDNLKLPKPILLSLPLKPRATGN